MRRCTSPKKEHKNLCVLQQSYDLHSYVMVSTRLHLCEHGCAHSIHTWNLRCAHVVLLDLFAQGLYFSNLSPTCLFCPQQPSVQVLVLFSAPFLCISPGQCLGCILPLTSCLQAGSWSSLAWLHLSSPELLVGSHSLSEQLWQVNPFLHFICTLGFLPLIRWTTVKQHSPLISLHFLFNLSVSDAVILLSRGVSWLAPVPLCAIVPTSRGLVLRANS